MFEGLAPSTPGTMGKLGDEDQMTPEETCTDPLLPGVKCGILTNKRQDPPATKRLGFDLL